MNSTIVGIAAIVGASAGCYPETALTPGERYVCPGTPVAIHWKAKGCATLSVTPQPPGGAPSGHVDDEGTFTLTAKQHTTVTLTASRFIWPSTSSVVDLDFDAGIKPLTVSLADPSAECDAGSVQATIHAAGFDPELVVGTVAVSREYYAEHDQRRAHLVPGAESDAFMGTGVNGPWLLRAPLDAGEACGQNLPRDLVINVLTRCVKGTP